MGASTFITEASGRDIRSAFHSAVETAAYDNGHSGYTGTIAEKGGFRFIDNVKSYKEAVELANKLIDEGDPRIDDKWGPAGAIKWAEGHYLFFGWASS